MLAGYLFDKIVLNGFALSLPLRVGPTLEGRSDRPVSFEMIARLHKSDISQWVPTSVNES
jgi:hypothetical protein